MQVSKTYLVAAALTAVKWTDEEEEEAGMGRKQNESRQHLRRGKTNTHISPSIIRTLSDESALLFKKHREFVQN